MGRRFKVNIMEVQRNFVMIVLMERGTERLKVASIYLPPQGIPTWSDDCAINFMQTCEDVDIVGGDFTYRPTEITAGDIWGQQTLEEAKKATETTRDIQKRTWWPRQLTTTPPRTTSAWSTRRCWRMSKGFQIDYLSHAPKLSCSGYEAIPAEVPTDHAPVMARVATLAAPGMRRSRRARPRAPTASKW